MNKQLLLEALITLKQNGPAILNVGICGNIAKNSGIAGTDCIREITRRACFWEHHSGDRVYPVPVYIGDLWDNPYRHELLDWLIEDVKRDIAEVRHDSKI